MSSDGVVTSRLPAAQGADLRNFEVHHPFVVFRRACSGIRILSTFPESEDILAASMPFEPRDYYVDPDIAKAETLPPASFSDATFLEHELRTIFARTWLLVPERSAAELRNDARSMAEIVKRRGARVPFSILDRPLFLQRDWKGKLRAFPNVCTHAWHTLVEGPGRDRTLTCPQHGRQFNCEGKFLAQPGFKDLADFPRDADHLRDFAVAESDPFLFVNLGTPESSPDGTLKPMQESIARLGATEFKRIANPNEVREVDGNWKQHAWNYMDKFHVAFIHRAPGGLADALDLKSYRTEIHGRSALQWAFSKDPAHGFDPRLLPERFAEGKRRVFALWWFVFPNMTFNFYPWGLSVNAYMPVPGKPERTLFLWYHYAADEEAYARRNEIWLVDQVDTEDIEAIAQVRRGVRSGYATRGRFAPGEEEGPHWFHRMVHTSVFERG